MSNSSWLTLAALSLLPFAVAAQTTLPSSDPGDARAPVPAQSFQSSFKSYLPLAESSDSADKLWIAANREVQADSGPQAPANGVAPVKPEPAAQAPDQHRHSKGH